MNTLWKSLVVGLIVLLALLYYRHTQRPELQLGRRLGKICTIAEKNVSSPERGVDELFTYFGENTPELAHDFGALLVCLGRIDDQREHDDRAREAAQRMWGPLARCGESLQEFGDAIERDPAASRKLQAGADRVTRSLTLLFGGEVEHFWPRSLGRFLHR
ncbi:MAG: hypothetical protein ABI321_11840 [Polyangia bacterium]